MIAKGFLERSERRLTRTVAGGDVFHFERVVQAVDDLRNVCITCDNQVKSPGDEVDAGVDRGADLNDSPCRCDITTKSSFVRSMPMFLAFWPRISGLLPVSNRMRFPPYSISAA